MFIFSNTIITAAITIVVIIGVLIYAIPYRNLKIIQTKLDKIINLLEKK